jgi:FkbM family methyltransferase
MNAKNASPGEVATAPTDTVGPPPGIRRRDVIVGLMGLAGGAAAASMVPPKKPEFPGDVTYAQSGEDIIIMVFCRHFKIDKPSYFDIGCWEPVASNNTFLMYRFGGRGVLVEPNPALTEKIRKTRPEDKLLPVGIGVSDAAEADYFVFNDSQLNTFDPDQVKQLSTEPNIKLEKTIKVPLVNINRAIAEHMNGKAPDILSIDIEGLDLAVLKTLDFTKYRPKMICAETIITNTLTHHPDTTLFMTSQGYEVHGMTFANTIYLDKKLLGT